MLKYFFLFALVPLCISCKKDDPVTHPGEAKLIVKLKVDPTQQRLGNLGQPVSVPAGHAAQSPRFNKIASHYLELAPTALTGLGAGTILYHAPETIAGGATAIDFSQTILCDNNGTFLTIPLKSITPGSYLWVRCSLSYQNYDVDFAYNGTPLTGTIASFVGFNTYITNYLIKTQTQAVNANKLQGYWGFETNGFSFVQTGQAPATTVPNPLFATSPIPAGSCVVTGSFANPLVITGNETSDVVVTLSLSTNNSFEWVDDNGNGKWDATNNSVEQVVDMGLRGLVPTYQ